jgi:hypothetical protein
MTAWYSDVGGYRSAWNGHAVPTRFFDGGFDNCLRWDGVAGDGTMLGHTNVNHLQGVWIKPASTATTGSRYIYWTEQVSSKYAYMVVQWSAASTAGQLYARRKYGSGTTYARSTARIARGQWSLVLGWGYSAAAANKLATTYQIGASKGSSVSETQFWLGQAAPVTDGTENFVGHMHGAFMYNLSGVTDTWARIVIPLMRGVPPVQVMPENLRFYAPDCKTDYKGRYELSVPGAGTEPPLHWAHIPQLAQYEQFLPAAAPGGSRPQNPLGHPLSGALGGPIG